MHVIKRKIKIKLVGWVQTPVLYILALVQKCLHRCRKLGTGAKISAPVRKFGTGAKMSATVQECLHRCLYSTGVCTHSNGFIFIFLSITFQSAIFRILVAALAFPILEN